MRLSLLYKLRFSPYTGTRECFHWRDRMALNATVMKAVEQLGYRVTVGDVATQAGLNVEVAQSDLLALAAETQAHLQVSEAGEIAYEFPRNFRGILQSKYWRLRLQQTWERVWHVLFYLIRISFGVLLLASIALIFVAIAIILIAMSSSRSEGDGDRGGGLRQRGGLCLRAALLVWA